MVRRLAAHGVCMRGIAREHEGLAAAAAEVLFLLIAASAGLLHPGVAPIETEGPGFVPYPPHVMIADIGELQPWQHSGLMTGQGESVRCDIEEDGTPAVHAVFGPVGIIIRHDEVELHL